MKLVNHARHHSIWIPEYEHTDFVNCYGTTDQSLDYTPAALRSMDYLLMQYLQLPGVIDPSFTRAYDLVQAFPHGYICLHQLVALVHPTCTGAPTAVPVYNNSDALHLLALRQYLVNARIVGSPPSAVARMREAFATFDATPLSHIGDRGRRSLENLTPHDPLPISLHDEHFGPTIMLWMRSTRSSQPHPPTVVPHRSSPNDSSKWINSIVQPSQDWLNTMVQHTAPQPRVV